MNESTFTQSVDNTKIEKTIIEKSEEIFQYILLNHRSMYSARSSFYDSFDSSLGFIGLWNQKVPMEEEFYSYFDKYGLDELKTKDVYLPINQIAAFENIPFINTGKPSAVDDCILLVQTLKDTYFSDSTLTYEKLANGNTSPEEVSFTLLLDGESYCYYSYIKSLIDDALWNRSFFSPEHPDLLKIVSDCSENFYNNGNFNISYQEASSNSELPDFKPLSVSFKLVPNFGNSRNYRMLLNLLNFSRIVHLLSDIYEPISQEVWALYEEQEANSQKKYIEASETFSTALESRIFSISEDTVTHKTGLKYLEKQNKTSLFKPFEQKEALLPKGTPVFVYSDSKNNWFVLPPTKTRVSLPGLELFGIFYYNKMENNGSKYTHYVHQRDEETGENIGSYEVLFDSEIFHDVLYSHYATDELSPLFDTSKDVIEKYPKFFSKTVLSFDDNLAAPDKKKELKQVPPVNKEVLVSMKNYSEYTRALSLNDLVILNEREDDLWVVKSLPQETIPSFTLSRIFDNEEMVYEETEDLLFPSLLDVWGYLKDGENISECDWKILKSYIVKTYDYSDFRNKTLLDIAMKTDGINIPREQLSFFTLDTVAYAVHDGDIKMCFDSKGMEKEDISNMFKVGLDRLVNEDSEFFLKMNISPGNKLNIIRQADSFADTAGFGFLYEVL